jgi:DNA-binding transcriptional LysR family regulator
MRDPRKIDVNLLVVLDALLKHRNLTHAGKSIGMSQPAVSGALSRLREQFDDELLVREGKIFELSEKAQQLLPTVEEAMLEVSKTFALVPEFDPATSNRTFFIAATDYLLSQLASPLKQLMDQLAPGVTIEFSTLSNDLDIGLIDLVRRDILIGSPDLSMPGKKAGIFSDRLVCVARAGHPLVKDGRITVEDLAKAELVEVVIGRRGTNLVDAALEQLGLRNRIGLSIRSVMAVPALIAATDFISWTPERLLGHYLEALDLQVVESPIPVITFEESAHWHPSKNNDPAIKWLVSTLQQAAKSL